MAKKQETKGRIKSIKLQKLLKSAKKNIKSKKMVTIIALVAILAIIAISFNLNRFSLSKKNVLVTVNGEEITSDMLDKRYDLFFLLSGYPESYKQLITKESFLDQLVNEELLVQDAIKNRISVLDKDVEKEVGEILDSSSISLEDFETQLKSAGFTIKDVYSYYKRQMMIARLVNETFAEIEVSNIEAKEYYDNNPDMFRAEEGQIRLRHILVATEEEAEAVLEQLKKGADFATLAKEKSICPSGPNGGDLGFVSRGQMVPEFEEAAFKLNVNQLSGIVQTQYGYHIIKRESNTVIFSEAKESIIENLKTEKQREMIAEHVESLREAAEIVITAQNSQPETVSASTSSNSCLSKFGLDDHTIIFYHASWCPHCQRMEPIVEELEKEGYKFHWAETVSGEGVDAVDTCFSDVLQGGIPQFICSGNKQYKMGEMTKEALKAFADSC